MSITLPLLPEQQAELERRAAAAGTDLTNFILDVVQEKLGEPAEGSTGDLSYEQWSSKFHAWIARQRSRNPNVDDSRESIYD